MDKRRQKSQCRMYPNGIVFYSNTNRITAIDVLINGIQSLLQINGKIPERKFAVLLLREYIKPEISTVKSKHMICFGSDVYPIAQTTILYCIRVVGLILIFEKYRIHYKMNFKVHI